MPSTVNLATMKLIGSASSLLAFALSSLASALEESTFEGFSGVSLGVPADANSIAIDRASAEWNVPKLCLPEGGDPTKEYYMSSWVGFAGNNCEGVRGALLQAGVTSTLRTDGTTTSDAWVEWYPRHAEFRGTIEVNPGDTVYIQVTASSRTTGVVEITNRSTGQTVQESFESPDPSDPNSNLCTGDATAYSVIESTGAAAADPSFFPGFSDIRFNGFEAVAFGDQQTYNMDSPGAVIYDMVNGETYATADRTSESEFLVHSPKSVCA